TNTCLFTAPFCRTGTVHPLGPLVPHRTAIDRSAIYRGRLRTVRTNQRVRQTTEQIATLRSVPSCRVQGLLPALFPHRRVRSITWSPWAMWWPCGSAKQRVVFRRCYLFQAFQRYVSSSVSYSLAAHDASSSIASSDFEPGSAVYTVNVRP